MSGFRLTEGGLIARDQPLGFQFDGKRVSGFGGDTVASALLGAGIRLVARSFKYHRPRGILAAGCEEPNALLELREGARREPNTRATVAELYEGLCARSQNRWPSLKRDLGAVNNWLSPIFVAGFYYKTFMWPQRFWEKLYEPLIRKAAGLGRLSHEADPDTYEKSHLFCDVLVIGAGAAGLTAALAAARSGARVVVCDEDFVPGGRLNAERCQVNGEPGASFAAKAVAALAELPDVVFLKRTTVFGVYDGNSFAALERVADHKAVPGPHEPRHRYWKIVARRSVLASGALERPIVFDGNDRPGVMLSSAVRTYLKRLAVAPGRRAVVYTTCNDGWRTAFDLVEAGVEVAAIIDVRDQVPGPMRANAERLALSVHCGGELIRAHGRLGLHSVTLRDAAGRNRRIRADLLAMCGGYNPNIALTTHLGGRPQWAGNLNAFLSAGVPPGMAVVGAAAGDYTMKQALDLGSAAGAEAASALGFVAGAAVYEAGAEEPVSNALWIPRRSGGKAFIDFQNDVTRADIELAAREGFRGAEHLKRYTTLGMATDQGKTSALNGHAIMAVLTQRATADLGTIAARPPYTPVAIGALAGAHRGSAYRPVRLTPGHDWAMRQRASFVESGEWLRAQWFTAPGDKDWFDSVVREVRAVRSGVGICDVSTLGKIDVQGPDAAAFIDRVYANMMSTLTIGKVRYGLMLREDGMVLDDGTAARFAAQHFVLSTTTANAGRVMQHLEFARQVLWPALNVQIASVSDQWAQFAVAGPRSRQLLGNLFADAFDCSNAALPYLGCAEFSWRGFSARLYRVSFSGELAYEVAVPAGQAEVCLAALMEAGAALGVVPYGLEALGVMRIEKGHAAGNELNGTTTARDLGLGKLLSGKKDFIGKVLGERPGLTDPARAVLVGVKPVNPESRLYAGAHFVAPGAAPTLASDQGFVSSVGYSPLLGHWIGLGFLVRGAARMGERMLAHDPVRSGDTEIEITAPCFYDPDGARLRS